MESVTWPQVLAWRVRRQLLDTGSDLDAVEVTRRLAGVQAQVLSAATLAIGIRQSHPDAEAVERALLDDRTLMRTWAMRGTLHLLPADDAAAFLAVSGAHRSWEKGSWQKAFRATPSDLTAMADAAADALGGGAALTREELTAEIVDRTGSAHLAELLGSGWGTLLKPLAWWGVLCHGPTRANRVTFVSPAAWSESWKGLPELDEAGRTVVRAYLRAYGPTSPDLFDKVWLSRGTTRKAVVRGWFAALGDELATVRVEGTELSVLADNLPELLEQEPTDSVRLLGGFDPYILGTGTSATEVVPAEHRSEVSRSGGWISPVVLRGGRVTGTWRPDGDTAEVTLWEDVPSAALASEVERIAGVLGQPLRLP